ncbi:hypothetical protein [Dictyobacter aurantiacus]|uniref:Uncharacterized protein n=1 Tax=Dictyobacter aurantiacus TaxID=1936993 RepID=A0A401ZGD9_9CHLR|nr:hypothetical protein [Dictyobacter aurantiacus]GCE05922.1 hypothetical protein KDAU_32510 [Dictyobacter aurantiacus]
MIYRLDLRTLLLMLGQSTGSLRAEFSHVPGIKDRCHIFLQLEEGSIRACSVKDRWGKEIVSGEAAVKLVQNQVLEWNFTETQLPGRAQNVPSRSRVPASSSPIPYRTYPILQQDFMTWPRLYRDVYALSDGRSSVNHIVMLLTHEQNAEKVLEVFVVLHRQGLIAFYGGQ